MALQVRCNHSNSSFFNSGLQPGFICKFTTLHDNTGFRVLRDHTMSVYQTDYSPNPNILSCEACHSERQLWNIWDKLYDLFWITHRSGQIWVQLVACHIKYQSKVCTHSPIDLAKSWQKRECIAAFKTTWNLEKTSSELWEINWTARNSEIWISSQSSDFPNCR